MTFYNFEIVVEKESEDGGYSAYSPTLPGCHSNGGTVLKKQIVISAKRFSSTFNLYSLMASRFPRTKNLYTWRS